jgi:hypothetical protein
LRYYKAGRDILINPLDSRARPWSFLKECGDDVLGDILIKSVAACLVDCGNAPDRFWEDAARIVFTETAKKVVKEGKSLQEFLDILLGDCRRIPVADCAHDQTNVVYHRRAP